MATYLVTETAEDTGQETVVATVEATSVRGALEKVEPSGAVTIYTVSGKRTARLETTTTTRMMIENGPKLGRPTAKDEEERTGK